MSEVRPGEQPTPPFGGPASASPVAYAYGVPQPVPYGQYPYPAAYPVQSVPQPARPATLGIVALILGGIALVGPTVMAAIFGWQVSYEIGSGLGFLPDGSGLTSLEGFTDLAFLTAVRGSVLGLEVAFWIGTVAGIWAIVQGICAIAMRRGRGQGIAALILGVVAPMVAFGVLYVVFLAGFMAGAADGAVPLA